MTAALMSAAPRPELGPDLDLAADLDLATDRRRGRASPSCSRSCSRSTMDNGHVGIFKREGKKRLPIQELRGSSPVDALLHAGEAQGVADRGGASFAATFVRVLPLEVGK